MSNLQPRDLASEGEFPQSPWDQLFGRPVTGSEPRRSGGKLRFGGDAGDPVDEAYEIRPMVKRPSKNAAADITTLVRQCSLGERGGEYDKSSSPDSLVSSSCLINGMFSCPWSFMFDSRFAGVWRNKISNLSVVQRFCMVFSSPRADQKNMESLLQYISKMLLNHE